MGWMWMGCDGGPVEVGEGRGGWNCFVWSGMEGKSQIPDLEALNGMWYYVL